MCWFLTKVHKHDQHFLLGCRDIRDEGWKASVVWKKNLGRGQFGPFQVIQEDFLDVGCVALADFNNDGMLDIVWASAANSTIAWQPNLGTCVRFCRRSRRKQWVQERARGSDWEKGLDYKLLSFMHSFIYLLIYLFTYLLTSYYLFMYLIIYVIYFLRFFFVLQNYFLTCVCKSCCR